MRFTSFIMAGFAAVASAIPAFQVASNIDKVTSLSRGLQTPAKGLSILDGPQLAVGQGNFPPIIQGFTEIVTTVTTYLDQMNPETYSGPDSDIIFDSFRTFVKVHQELLNILIGKSGIFSTVPFVGQPVAAVLRAVEGGVDALAFALIDMMEARTMEMKDEADALSSTIGTAIDQYSGLNL